MLDQGIDALKRLEHRSVETRVLLIEESPGRWRRLPDEQHTHIVWPIASTEDLLRSPARALTHLRDQQGRGKELDVLPNMNLAARRQSSLTHILRSFPIVADAPSDRVATPHEEGDVA